MKAWALVTHDEQGLGVTVHLSKDDAYNELRSYLCDEYVDYQDPPEPDATHEDLAALADDRSQFAWLITEVEES